MSTSELKAHRRESFSLLLFLTIFPRSELCPSRWTGREREDVSRFQEMILSPGSVPISVRKKKRRMKGAKKNKRGHKPHPFVSSLIQ